MTARYELITPARAVQLLAGMGPNRRLSIQSVNRMAAAMLSGIWHDTGAPIRLHLGQLVDGQHRLSAVVKSGVAIKMLVVTLDDDRALPHVDTGMKRQLSHALSIAGHRNTTQMASITNVVDAYLNGHSLRSIKTDNDRLVYIAAAYADRLDAVIKLMEGREFNSFYSRSTLGAMGLLAMESDIAKAYVLFDKLGSGAGLAANEPALLLAKRLRCLHGDGGGGAMRHLSLGLCLRAWNMHYAGATATRLQFTRDQELPEVAGLGDAFRDEWNSQAVAQ